MSSVGGCVGCLGRASRLADSVTACFKRSESTRSAPEVKRAGREWEEGERCGGGRPKLEDFGDVPNSALWTSSSQLPTSRSAMRPSAQLPACSSHIAPPAPAPRVRRNRKPTSFCRPTPATGSVNTSATYAQLSTDIYTEPCSWVAAEPPSGSGSADERWGSTSTADPAKGGS